MSERVVAVLGTGLVDAAQPILRADDLGVLRGDGIFETLLVRDREPWLLEEHLTRLAASAERMDLPAPAAHEWRGLVGTALERWPASTEGVLRLVCTRGPEAGGPPTAYATVGPVPAELLRQRRDGVAVVTRTLGVPTQLRRDAPWLLGGVKSTSYAVAMAAGREARRGGADDLIWLSVDGDVLEATTSTVVWAVGSTLQTIPTATGILAGTTVERLFVRAPAAGFEVTARLATLADLHAADAVWLLSSVRGVAVVRSIDGRPRGDAGLTEAIRDTLELS